MLEPTDQDEISLLHQRQISLQSCFGGKPIENVHLTCQRFEPQVTLVEQTLVARGIIPLYTSGFVSSLIAVLKDVPEPSSDSLSNYDAFYHHLFIAGKAVLSKIVDPNEFEILAVCRRGVPESRL